MGKVKQHLEKTFKKESEELKSAMKAYNSSGYKAFSIFVFGEAATAISRSFQAGSVVALLNPKLMKETKGPAPGAPAQPAQA